jgi:CRP/FNR family transcriptional regulator
MVRPTGILHNSKAGNIDLGQENATHRKSMTKKEKLLKIETIKVSCQKCSLAELCMPHGMELDEVNKLDEIMKRQQPYQPGQHLFHAGDKSSSIFAVRSGAVKTYCITEDGDEQVLGFGLPGELVGFDGLAGNHYSSTCVALETTSICELPFNRLEELCQSLPGLQKQMFRLVGKEIASDHHMLMMLGQRSAEERLASFLLSLSIRYRNRHLSASEFYLPMSRQDIGNYLGLAIETVSRLFAHFQDEKLLTVNRKQIKILDHAKLKAMVDGCAGDISESA